MTYTNATGTAPVAVSVPPPSGVPHAVLFNVSDQVAYLGGQYVTSVSGLPLYPNCKADLANMPGTVYAVAGFNQVPPSGTTSAALGQGGSVLTIPSNPGYAIGSPVVLEAGTQRQEIATIAGTASGGTGMTISAGAVFAHSSGIAVSTVSPLVTTVNAVAGAS